MDALEHKLESHTLVCGACHDDIIGEQNQLRDDWRALAKGIEQSVQSGSPMTFSPAERAGASYSLGLTESQLFDVMQRSSCISSVCEVCMIYFFSR